MSGGWALRGAGRPRPAAEWSTARRPFPRRSNVLVATTAKTSRTLNSFRRPALGRGICRPWRRARIAMRTGIANDRRERDRQHEEAKLNAQRLPQLDGREGQDQEEDHDARHQRAVPSVPEGQPAKAHEDGGQAGSHEHRPDHGRDLRLRREAQVQDPGDGQEDRVNDQGRAAARDQSARGHGGSLGASAHRHYRRRSRAILFSAPYVVPHRLTLGRGGYFGRGADSQTVAAVVSHHLRGHVRPARDHGRQRHRQQCGRPELSAWRRQHHRRSAPPTRRRKLAGRTSWVRFRGGAASSTRPPQLSSSGRRPWARLACSS